MTTLCFVTIGEIDIRAFTTFGVNAKPNSKNPIGYFGTGLKYAIAVLCRMGGKVTVMIDGVEHEFYSKDTDFRGKSFGLVRMRRRKDIFSRWRYEELPFTTEFGKNWEAWQVFRELESNTRDENGQTLLIDDEDPHGMSFLNDHHRGKTVIMVTDSDVIEAYRNIDDIFLRKDLEKREGSGEIEIYNHPSKHVYYRGLRVMDLEKPAMFTYNFVRPMDLTEDRTLKYPFVAKYLITDHVLQSDDESLIDSILNMDEDKQWEGSLEFDSADQLPSPTFVAAVGSRKKRALRVPNRITTFYDRYYARKSEEPTVTIELKQSELDLAYEVLNQVDLYDMASKLGWEEEDERFNGFVRLRDEMFQHRSS